MQADAKTLNIWAGHLRYLAIGTVVLVFAITAGWEFLFVASAAPDGTLHRPWQSVAAATLASAMAVCILYLACRWLGGRRTGADRRREAPGPPGPPRPTLPTLPATETTETTETTAGSAEGALNQTLRVARLAHWRWEFATRRLTSWSGEFPLIFGATHDEVDPLDEGQFRWVHPDDRERLAAVYRAATRENPGFDICYRILRRDGEVRYVREVAEPEFDSAGRAVAHFGILQDITELRQTEDALRESEARYRSLYNNTPAMMHSLDAEGRILSVSDRWHRALGYEHDEVIGRPVVDFMTDESRTHALNVTLPAFFRTGKATNLAYQFVKKNGELMDVLVSAISEKDQYGKVLRSLAIVDDVTERKRAETALRESEARFRAIIENSPNAISLKDVCGRYLLVNSDFADLAGLANDEIVGKTSHQVFNRAFADSGVEHDREVINARRAILRDEQFRNGGAIKEFLTIKFPVVGNDGDVAAVGAIHVDVTDRNRTEAELRRIQRMDAVGQLTGGVAHDFNNLLASVVLHAGLLERRIDNDEKGSHLVEQIRAAVERGKSLTNRLLAFSRQQALSPRSSDVSRLIGGLEDMLRRTLGETIDLRVDIARDLWPALIDPHQFENALINLAINARDAMPGGGTLVITTTNVELDEAFADRLPDVTSGDYVTVIVSDTGSGMSTPVLEKAFEPFFSTKDAGDGSGLGLSMVYGFVKQSNGHVTIDSTVGEGTTVTLYLARSFEPAAVPDHPEYRQGIAGGVERILVVEDERSLRQASVTVLCDNGYDVAEAGDANAAIDLLRSGRTFDLLFTDLVLPGGMTGIEVAAQAKRLQPGIKVVYTTGYAESTIGPRRRLNPDAPLIEKPCEHEALLAAIRGELDRDVA